MERTKIITSISIVAVVVAAAAAVGANVGLLENATGTKVGELAAAGDLPTTAAAGTGTSAPAAADPGGSAAGSQRFLVDRAGSVTRPVRTSTSRRAWSPRRSAVKRSALPPFAQWRSAAERSSPGATSRAPDPSAAATMIRSRSAS